MNLSVLIHTFNGYQHLWPGMAIGVGKHISGVEAYWGTDINERWPQEFSTVCGTPFHVMFSGVGEWSDRLRILLTQVPTDYILYMQEDHWPTAPPPDLNGMMEIVTQNNLLRLQLSPIVRFYRLNQVGSIHYFDPSSKYLVSHQPSIWKKSFLLDCLHPGETPWVNEYKGTLRWQVTTQKRDFIRNKIAIYPCDWFSHKCIKGKVVES